MATRAQLRTTLRERLEDTSGVPLWADPALNEFLAAAVRTYGVTFPKPATAATAALVAGDTGVALPAAVPERGIVAVCDAHGRDVPRATERQGPASADATGLSQAWWVWAGTLRLQRPVSGDEVGTWAIDYLGRRELVADDVSQQPMEAGDEPIVIALAGAQATQRRMVEDAKRGARVTEVGEAARRFAEEASRLIAARKRRVRSGYVTLA
jgi:hypothetical protein